VASSSFTRIFEDDFFFNKQNIKRTLFPKLFFF